MSSPVKAFSYILILLAFLPAAMLAQDRDTTRQELEIEQDRRDLNLQQYLDRSMSGGMMTEMGTYQVPEETQYYIPPFKGQEYLDMAVEAYRKELEQRIGPDWLSQFFRTISPFIHNEFEFGVYQIYDLPIVERDHPHFQSDQ